jgi:hypothetical protein
MKRKWLTAEQAAKQICASVKTLEERYVKAGVVAKELRRGKPVYLAADVELLAAARFETARKEKMFRDRKREKMRTLRHGHVSGGHCDRVGQRARSAHLAGRCRCSGGARGKRAPCADRLRA